MINIEHIENIDEKYYAIIDSEFDKFAIENGVTCHKKKQTKSKA